MGAPRAATGGRPRVRLGRDPARPVRGPRGQAPAVHAGRLLLALRPPIVAGVRCAADRWLPVGGGGSLAVCLHRADRRPDEGCAGPVDLPRPPLVDADADGDRRCRRAADPVHRPRHHQAPGDRRPIHHTDPLAVARLCAAAEPRLLPERFCRPRRQQGHAGRARIARKRRPGDRRALVCRDLLAVGHGPIRPGRHSAAHPAGCLVRRLCRRDGLLHPAVEGPRRRDLGSPLDAHRADRRQLHQHDDGQAVRPHRARGPVRPHGAERTPFAAQAAIARHDADGVLSRFPQRSLAASLDRPCDLAVAARQCHAGCDHADYRFDDPHRQHVGLGDVDGRRHL